MTDQKSILQSRARTIRREYRWGCFDDFNKEDDYGYNMLTHCKELEGNYKQFVDFLLCRREFAWPVNPSSGHLNPLRDFARYREHGDRYGNLDIEGGAKKWFYNNLGAETLDTLVRLLKSPDEALVLLPKYWPEVFGDSKDLERRYVEMCRIAEEEMWRESGMSEESIDEQMKEYVPMHHKDKNGTFGYRIHELIEEMGREELKCVLKQRIPWFPSEVHDTRLQLLEDGLTVLNALHSTTTKYAKEKGFEIIVKKEGEERS